ncbi:MAG: DNA-processing protein DprA [Crocinitomicaceae bacterium]
MDQRIFQIAVSLLNGLGPLATKTLIRHVGDLEEVFTASSQSLGKIDSVRPSVVSKLERSRAIERAKKEVDFIEENNIQLYFYQDINYPKALKECPDGPIVLFTLGKINFNRRNISIVGTRRSTSYGKKMTDELIRGLAPYNVQIISGLAHGIDKISHEAAISNALPTIGVLGHGLDTMYPAAHRSLAKKMTENGGLVTEFISGVVGEPGNFPRRNRIVAGLSEATVVVESSETGGSMITANLANDYNREVFAFPGPADKESSRGCNNLIRRSRAHLISSAENLIQVMGWDEIEENKSEHIQILEDLSEEETKIVAVFSEKGVLDIDTLAFESALNPSQISVHLFNLEMKGAVKSLPGKRFCLA